MRKVAFVYVHEQQGYDGGYDSSTFGNIIENWTEVDDETYKMLCMYFRSTTFYGSGYRKLIMVEHEEDMAPRLIKEVIEIAAHYKRQAEIEVKRAAEKKAERMRKKLEKDVASKKELLEKLKQELGEK